MYGLYLYEVFYRFFSLFYSTIFKEIVTGDILKVSLAAYNVRIRKKHDRGIDSYQKLDNFDEEHDFLDIFEAFLNSLGTKEEDTPESQQIFRRHRQQKIDRKIQGQFYLGEYGQACDVVNAQTKKVAYKKAFDDADMLPFFFSLGVPINRDEGMLLVENRGGKGVKDLLSRLLKGYFSRKFPDFVVTFSPIHPREYIEELLDSGKVRQIKFIRIGIPSDIADSLESGHEEVPGKMEIKFQAKRGTWLPIKEKIQRFLRGGKRDLRGFYEFPDFEYDEIKLQVDIKSGTRTIDLGSLNSTPLYDLSGKVQIDKNGHPIYESIQSAADQLSTELQEEMYATDVS